MHLHHRDGLPGAPLCGQRGRLGKAQRSAGNGGVHIPALIFKKADLEGTKIKHTLLPRCGRQISQAPVRHHALACRAVLMDCKQQQSKHLCMQPAGAPGNSTSHSCSTSWRLSNSSPSSSVMGSALEAKVQSTNISWSLRASSQLPSLSVSEAILAATAAAAAAAGDLFCL